MKTTVLSEILIDAKLDSRNGYSKTQHVQQSQHLTDSDQLFSTSPTLMTSQCGRLVHTATRVIITKS